MEVNIGDWVLTHKGEIVKIILDDMPNLSYGDIEKVLTKDEVKQGIIEDNIDPIEANEYLEKRMYFFVLSSLKGINQGIQAGHAALEYANKYHTDFIYRDFIENWKTWIILNGGTTNSSSEYRGSLNDIHAELSNNNIKCAGFYEPDLNDALSAICFLVDERVFNKKDFLDFEEYMIKNNGYSKNEIYDNEDHLREQYKNIVGDDVYFLKELLKNKRLA